MPGIFDFMTVADAARAIGAAEPTIRTAIRKGRLPSRRVLGRIVVETSALEEYRRRTRPDGVKPKGRPRSLSGLGYLAGLSGSVDDFIARKAEEKALER
jgi:excisionase family DNA binding protein